MNTFNGFSQTALGLSRNPLGIIALFVVLVYGIAGLVFSVSAQHLTPPERFPIILFLSIFPALILATFAYLVAYHHTKLYSPRDFPQDDGFIRALQVAPPSASKKRAQEEAEEIEKDMLAAPSDHTQSTGQESVKADTPHTRVASDEEKTPLDNRDNDSVVRSGNADAFLSGLTETLGLATLYATAEELVFRELERQFSVPVRRNVALGSREFDGVVLSQRPIVVEVKFMHKGLLNTIERTLRSLDKSLSSFPDISIILALVSRENPDSRLKESIVSKVDQITSGMKRGISVSIYRFDELNDQYGLYSGPTRPDDKTSD